MDQLLAACQQKGMGVYQSCTVTYEDTFTNVIIAKNQPTELRVYYQKRCHAFYTQRPAAELADLILDSMTYAKQHPERMSVVNETCPKPLNIDDWPEYKL